MAPAKFIEYRISHLRLFHTLDEYRTKNVSLWERKLAMTLVEFLRQFIRIESHFRNKVIGFPSTEATNIPSKTIAILSRVKRI